MKLEVADFPCIVATDVHGGNLYRDQDKGYIKMRINGRRPDEMRPVKITPNYLKYAEGSVLIEAGDTRVICALG